MPLLGEKTEFATKWIALYDSHMDVGIHDPISTYEFLGKFYVQEGNKRVSVMKAVGAFSIPGTVIRVIPKPSEDPKIKIYYDLWIFIRWLPPI